MREQYNDKIMKEELDLEMAALFVFLNKHCFNGVYRIMGRVYLMFHIIIAEENP